MAASRSVDAKLRANGCKGGGEEKQERKAEEAAKSLFLSHIDAKRT